MSETRLHAEQIDKTLNRIPIERFRIGLQFTLHIIMIEPPLHVGRVRYDSETVLTT